MTIIESILKLLSMNDVCCFNYGEAIHSKFISQALNINYEETKKLMKQMKKEGLVKYENKRYRVCSDYEMQEYYTHYHIGWVLTDKARTTDIWKIEKEKEDKIFKECFIDPLKEEI